MERRELVMVDIFDNQLGEITKEEAHKNPILHRAFSVFLVNNNNEMLIQKRAEHKYHSGGLWANACCSHPKIDEDVIASAVNRLKEELNITCNVKELFTFIYLHKFHDNLYEYELDHVMIGKYSGNVILNTDEASEFRWVSLDQLSKELIKEPNKFASWFLICAPRVIKELKNKA